MLNFLSKIIPIYVNYTTLEGNPGVRARTWHPAWFIPIVKLQIKYWLGIPERYSSYKESLGDINDMLSMSELPPSEKLDNIKLIIWNVDCGFECDLQEPYGFVPEAGCPIHDR